MGTSGHCVGQVNKPPDSCRAQRRGTAGRSGGVGCTSGASWTSGDAPTVPQEPTILEMSPGCIGDPGSAESHSELLLREVELGMAHPQYIVSALIYLLHSVLTEQASSRQALLRTCLKPLCAQFKRQTESLCSLMSHRRHQKSTVTGPWDLQTNISSATLCSSWLQKL
jgi:hypothetical protein